MSQKRKVLEGDVEESDPIQHIKTLAYCIALNTQFQYYRG